MTDPRTGRLAAGYVLIVCLLLLIGASLAAVALLRSSTLQERMAGQTREKQRAFEAAQAALRFGERWLDAGSGLSGPCAGTQPASVLQACTNPLGGASASCLTTLAGAQADPSLWPARFEFTPAAMAVDAAGGVAGGGDIHYAAPPGLYIESAGLAPGGAGQLYCVTAYGFGGAPGTLSIVRSLYLVPGSSGGGSGGSSGSSGAGAPPS